MLIAIITKTQTEWGSAYIPAQDHLAVLFLGCNSLPAGIFQRTQFDTHEPPEDVIQAQHIGITQQCSRKRGDAHHVNVQTLAVLSKTFLQQQKRIKIVPRERVQNLNTT